MLINDVDSFDQIFGKQMDFEEQSKFFFILFINKKIRQRA